MVVGSEGFKRAVWNIAEGQIATVLHQFKIEIADNFSGWLSKVEKALDDVATHRGPRSEFDGHTAGNFRTTSKSSLREKEPMITDLRDLEFKNQKTSKSSSKGKKLGLKKSMGVILKCNEMSDGGVKEIKGIQSPGLVESIKSSKKKLVGASNPSLFLSNQKPQSNFLIQELLRITDLDESKRNTSPMVSANLITHSSIDKAVSRFQYGTSDLQLNESTEKPIRVTSDKMILCPKKNPQTDRKSVV